MMRCLAARVHYKTLIVICALLSLLTVLLWNKCTSEKALRFLPRHPQPPPSPKIDTHPQQPQPPEPPPVVGGVRYEEIDCLINDDATIKGRREGSEVYMPFSWMEKYFEVYGKVVQYDGYDRFEFSHSYSKVYAQREQYHPNGVFMSFEGYNVEVRDRVKCISGVEGELCGSGYTSYLNFYDSFLELFSFIFCHFFYCPTIIKLERERGG